LNPKEGIKIHAFKNAHTSEAMADRELEKLTRYLVHIAALDDFRTIAHKVRDYHGLLIDATNFTPV
jgi:ubiquitin-like domain-containing CTD phosphatase 1